MKFLFGIVFAALAATVAAAVVVVSGMMYVAATAPVSGFERAAATLALNRSVARRAPKAANPVKATPEILSKALKHYKAMCLTCHGAGAVDPSAIGEGLNPPAPDLSQ